MSSPSLEPRRWTGWPWIELAVALLGTGVLRFALLKVPLERDEGEYAYIGRVILDGGLPYRDAANMKLPGVHYAYALILRVFGETAVGVRLGILAVTTLSTLLAFLLGRRIGGDAAGVATALLFGVFSASSATLGFTGNAEHFVVLFLLAGLLGLLSGLERRLASRVALGGLCLGTSVLMKQHAALFVAFGLACVVLSVRDRWRTAVRWGGLFAAAAALPWAVTVLYFVAEGAFDDFWKWTVEYAWHYTQQSSWERGGLLLMQTGGTLGALLAPVFALALVGMVSLLRRPELKPWRSWLLGLTLVSLATTLPGLHFRPHYFLLTAPAIALLAGLGAAATGRGIAARLSKRGVAGAGPTGRPGLATDGTNDSSGASHPAPAAVTRVAHSECRGGAGLLGFATAVVAGLGCVALDAPVLRASPEEASRIVYETNAFPEMVEVARYIEAHSRPDDRIAVLGSEPQIYFYAHRRAAVSSVYTYALMERHPFARDMQRQMIQEIESHAPRYVVFVWIVHSWLQRPDSPRDLLNWFQATAPRRYRPVGRIEILTQDGRKYTTDTTWGPDAGQKPPRSPWFILVLERL